jgi:hypothetical protein
MTPNPTSQPAPPPQTHTHLWAPKVVREDGHAVDRPAPLEVQLQLLGRAAVVDVADVDAAAVGLLLGGQVGVGGAGGVARALGLVALVWVWVGVGLVWARRPCCWRGE